MKAFLQGVGNHFRAKCSLFYWNIGFLAPLRIIGPPLLRVQSGVKLYIVVILTENTENRYLPVVGFTELSKPLPIDAN
jgi:hypothetical protein